MYSLLLADNLILQIPDFPSTDARKYKTQAR